MHYALCGKIAAYVSRCLKGGVNSYIAASSTRNSSFLCRLSCSLAYISLGPHCVGKLPVSKVRLTLLPNLPALFA